MVSEERGRVLLVGRMYLRAGWWWPELRRELTSSVKLSMDQLHSAQAHKNTTVNSTRYNSEPEREDNNSGERRRYLRRKCSPELRKLSMDQLHSAQAHKNTTVNDHTLWGHCKLHNL
jgi:hypothetical protein